MTKIIDFGYRTILSLFRVKEDRATLGSDPRALARQ
jgi:hypothetical protein